MEDTTEPPNSALKVRALELLLGGTSILNGVDLSVASGESLGIIGPNGSGKTTLFNALSGFLKPQSGSISLFGKDVTKLPPHQRAHLGIGRVFQNFGIFREMTVLENILIALESKKRGILFPWSKSTRVNREKALSYLELANITEKASAKAGSLSGGQMRLLEMSRLLAFGAEVLLLDEPTAGVSPKMKSEIENAILKLQAEKKTVLIIEHDINFIQRFCKRIAVLDSGKVVLDGSPEEIRNDPQLQDIYFGKVSASA